MTLAAHLARRSLAEIVASMRPSLRRKLARVASRLDGLILPAQVYRTVPVEWCGRTRVLAGGAALQGAGVARLAGAERVVIGFATIGDALGCEVADCFARGDAVTGLLLDQLGSAALLHLGRRLEAAIRLSAYRSGQRAGSPLHPGDDGVPLDAQADLARLAEAGRCGIRVTDTAMLAPAKSLSMVVALGHRVRRWSRAEVCRACPSQGRCRHGQQREACA